MIDKLEYCTPDLHTNSSTNVPFVGDSSRGYESVSAGMFNDLNIMVEFPFPMPKAAYEDPMNMISSIMSGSLGSCDPWVVLHHSEAMSFGDSMSLLPTEIYYSMIKLVGSSIDLDLVLP